MHDLAMQRRRFDAVVRWRLGHNMRHLVTLLDELRALRLLTRIGLPVYRGAY